MANPMDALNRPHVRPSTKQTVSALVWALADLGGEIHSTSGKAGRALLHEAMKRGYQVGNAYTSIGSGSLSQLYGEMESGRFAGMIKREGVARQTYTIRLLLTEDQLPPRPGRPSVETSETIKAETPETQEVDEVHEPITATDPIDALLLIQQLAMEAAISVAAATGNAPAPAPDQSELVAIKEKLAETLEENQRLRRKVAEVCETTNAKAKENEALRKALMVSSSNLKAMRDASSQTNGLERKLANLKDTQRFMAQRPRVPA